MILRLADRYHPVHYVNYALHALSAVQWRYLAFAVNNGVVNVNVIKKISGTNFPNVFTANADVFLFGV